MGAQVFVGATCAALASVSPAGEIRAIALGAGVLALFVDGDEGTRRIARYDAETGASVGRCEVPATITPRLDLASGRTRTAWTPRRFPLGVALEGRTLVWAENGNGRARAWTLVLPD